MRLSFLLVAIVSQSCLSLAQNSRNSSSPSSSPTTTFVTSSASLSSDFPAITSPPAVPGNESCSAYCDAWATTSFYGWKRIWITETLTAATIIYVVNNRTNTTRTLTSFNSLPPGHTLPSTNAAGTRIENITFTRNYGASKETITTELTFPTIYTNWPVRYTWTGTLSTTDAAGQGICSTEDIGKAVLFSSYTQPQGTQPTMPADLSGDTAGLLYATVFYTSDCAPVSGMLTRNPNDVAIQSCHRSHCALPEAIIASALYLTETSISHEDVPITTPNLPPPSSPSPPPNNPPTPNNPPPPNVPQQDNLPPAQSPSPGDIIASVIGAGSGGGNPPASQGGSSSGGGGGGNGASGSGNNPAGAPPPVPVPAPTPGQGLAAPTPVATLMVGDAALPASFTAVPTVIGGQQTTVSAVVIGSQTAAVGQTITVNNVPVAVQPGPGRAGAAPLVIVGASSRVSALGGGGGAAAGAAPTPAVLTVGGQKFTANAAGQFVVGGQTLTPGKTVTVGGQAVAVSTDGQGRSFAVYGEGTTISFYRTGAGTATESGDEIGGAIVSGLAGSGGGSRLATTEKNDGAAVNRARWEAFGLVLAVGLGVVLL